MRPALLLLCCAAPLAALSAGAVSVQDEASSSGPSNISTPGGSQALARSLLAEMRLRRVQEDLCQAQGCIVILNESGRFEVTGFHVAEPGKGGLRWSRNQFGDPLQPRRATFRFKSAREDCARPVRFELRHRETREVVALERVVDFCPTPKVHSLVRIDVLYPRVIVEPDGTAR